MPSFLHFVKYNNALPIVIALVLVGTGGAFAATDPGAVYSSSQQVVTVDNTYIANKDLSTWTPSIQITGVTEDADNYYVAYDFTTIDIVDYAWQDTVKHQTMTVAKTQLAGGDLGIYVTGQFRNIIANELAYLTQVQQKARKDTTQETVATTYGGLIGKMLTDTTQTLPGYTPVVQAPVLSSAPSQTAAVAESAGAGASASTQSGGSSLMSLQILGNNPAIISIGASYNDLGVVLIDPNAPNLGYHVFVNGEPESAISIDTSTTSAYAIEYRATDQDGNALMVRRIVLVGGATDPGGEINTAGSASASPPPQTQPQPQTPPQTPAQSLPPSSQSAVQTSDQQSATSTEATSSSVSATSSSPSATSSSASDTPVSTSTPDNSSATTTQQSPQATSTPDTSMQVQTGTLDASSTDTDANASVSSDASSTDSGQ